MTHTHPEAAEYAEHEAELAKAAGNEVECESCDGTGKQMVGSCAGGIHHEIYVDCEDCNGTGVRS